MATHYPQGPCILQFAANHDTILYYPKSDRFSWNPHYAPYSAEYLQRYNLIDEKTKLRFQATSLLNPNPDRPNLTYEFAGHTKVWRWTRERMLEAEKKGLIYFPPSGGVPREKRFLDDQEGVPISSVWGDIPPVNAVAKERLGYPTQKPLALLERILSASSNEGDVVLDPFCGCGTTVHAAEKLKRQWISIDVTHLSISVIEKRLRDAFPGIKFEIHGSPKDLEGARNLAARDKHQFQWWAVSLVNAAPQNSRKKGADGSIDGHIYFRSGARTTEKAIVSVKGGGIGVKDVRELGNVVDREKAKIGVFISLEPHTRPMVKEAAGAGLYEGPTGKVPKIQLFTIEELLGGKRPRIPLIERAFKITEVEDMEEQDELDL